MKIHYSPYFDGDHYIDFQSRKNLLIDELVVGNTGLLNELELRAGLSCECLSSVERQANYYNAVKLVSEVQKDYFIKKSFQIDEYGVASEMLRWRDELVLAGWDPDMRDISAKLNFLSDVEKQTIAANINIKGESDRWKSLNDSNLLPLNEDDELIIHFPEKYLPPYFAALIRKLADKGLKHSFQVPDKTIAKAGTNLQKVQNALLSQTKETIDPLDPNEKESFRILRFDRQNSALDWVVTKSHCAGSVFINSDNRSFDNVQSLFGSPLSGSSLTYANPEIVQLFKLGCSLFIRPLNIYNLLSYLQISKHPLPFKLRRDLIDVIISEGGIVNNKWKKILAEFIAAENKKKGKKKNIMAFLPLEQGNDNGINLEGLKEYVKELRTWTSQTLIIMSEDNTENVARLVLHQLSSLLDLYNALLIILNGQTSGNISNEKLKSWILSIYKPKNFPNNEPQTKSRFVIKSTAAFVDIAEEVIWIDCYNGIPKADMYRFLNTAEQNALLKKNLHIWCEEDQVKAQLYEQKMAILNCRSKFTIVTSEKDKGEKLNVHPVLVQLCAQFENTKCLESINPVPEGESIEIINQNLPVIPLLIDVSGKNLFKPREKESYSSLSQLIQNPLDYVFTYQAGLSDSSVIELSDEKRTKGNVAHLFIEELVEDSERDLSRMRENMAKDFQSRFDKAVLQKGAILLLDENRISLTRFNNQLRLSVNNLLDIIEHNKLKIIGCEVQKDCSLEDMFQLEARIDMLLCDIKGESVIFDMKWASTKNQFRKIILENKSLQLEVYKEVLKKAEGGSKVSAVAYFDISHGRLETSFAFNGDHVNITIPENSDNIFSQAMNSYIYRWKQLQEGKIEVAENMDMADIEYNTDRPGNNLYPLKPDYSKKNLKAVNGYSRFQIFKGGLK